MFPELTQRLKNQYFSYQDKNKKWMKQQMRNVMYIQYLPDKVTDELTIILNQEFYSENEEIFKVGDVPEKIFILVSGQIECFLKISDGELILDTLEESGCVMNQINILNK
jgi:CRP-like cAMP-binding protein